MHAELKSSARVPVPAPEGLCHSGAATTAMLRLPLLEATTYLGIFEFLNQYTHWNVLQIIPANCSLPVAACSAIPQVKQVIARDETFEFTDIHRRKLILATKAI